jgi:hypothetical protein
VRYASRKATRQIDFWFQQPRPCDSERISRDRLKKPSKEQRRQEAQQHIQRRVSRSPDGQQGRE